MPIDRIQPGADFDQHETPEDKSLPESKAPPAAKSSEGAKPAASTQPKADGSPDTDSSLASPPSRQEKRNAGEAAEDAGDTYAHSAEDALNGDTGARDSLSIAVTGKSYDELEQEGGAEWFNGFLKDVAARRTDPEVKVANRDNGLDVSARTEGDWLPANTNGAFVPGKDGQGTIVVAKDLKGPELNETMLEEYGEALAEKARAAGVEVHEGDAGARLALVAGGGDDAMMLNANGQLFQKSPSDQTTVVLDGVQHIARAATQVDDITITSTGENTGQDPALAYVPASETDGNNVKSAAGLNQFMYQWGGTNPDTGQELMSVERFAEATGISVDTAARLGQHFYPGETTGMLTKQQVGAMMADGIIPQEFGLEYKPGQVMTIDSTALDGGRVANALVNASGRVHGFFPSSADGPMNELTLQPMFEDVFGLGSISAETAKDLAVTAVQFNPSRTTVGASVRDIKNFIDMGYLKIDLGKATTGPTVTTAFPADIEAAGLAAIAPLQAAPHTEPGFWSSLWGDVTDPGKLVTDIASFVGHAEADIASFLNNEMDAAEALAKGMHTAVTAFAQEIQKGTASALEHLEAFGSAIKTGLEDLSAGAGEMVDNMIAEAKKVGGEMAFHALMAVSGLSKKQASSMLHEMSEKFKLVTHLQDLTLDDVKSMVPNFDELVELGTALEKEFAESASQTGTATGAEPEMTPENAFSNLSSRKLMSAQLEEAGMTVTTEGQVMNADGSAATDTDLRDWYSQHMRIDIGGEISGSQATGAPGAVSDLNVLQGRGFLTMPRKNKAGDLMMDFRVRELNLTGAAVGGKGTQGDAGLAGIRDFVIPFHVGGAKDGQKGDLEWTATTALLAEWTPGTNQLGTTLKKAGSLLDAGGKIAAGFGGEFDVTGITQAVGNIGGLMQTIEDEAPIAGSNSLEFGGGVGISTTYNLSNLGGKWWTPMAMEIMGAAGGTALGAGALAALGGTGPLGTAIVEKVGPDLLLSAAQLGSMVGDLGFSALADDDIAESSVGIFGWGAYLHTGLEGGGGDVGVKLRTRVQANMEAFTPMGF